jgi:hypothetical protein
MATPLPLSNNRMATPPPTPSVKCHYHSSVGVVGPNVSIINYYACACGQAFHSYCYSLGILRKNILGHFDAGNTDHPCLKIACKKERYGSFTRQRFFVLRHKIGCDCQMLIISIHKNASTINMNMKLLEPSILELFCGNSVIARSVLPSTSR